MRLDRAGFAVALIAFAALAYLYFPESIDDAYITLRFARNFLRGHGPVFNVGERVEGYSNFAWMVMLAAVGRAGVPMAIAMKVLSFGAGLATLFLVRRLAAAWFGSRAAIATATLLLGTSSFFAVWAVDGLETMFYTLLLTALAAALIQDGPRALRIGVLAGLVTLTRPEGALFALLAVGILAARTGWRSGLRALAPVALCGLGYEAFRLLYFGELASNVARVKMHPGLDTAALGLRHLLAFDSASGHLVLPAALLGIAATRKIGRFGTLVLFLEAQVLFLMLSGGDFMFGYRFVVPVLPFIALLCAAAVEFLQERFHRIAALCASGVLVAAQAVAQFASLPHKHFGLDNLTFRSGALFDAARYLAPAVGATDSVVLSEAGILGHSIEARVVDYLGLISPFELVAPDRNAVDTRYVLSTRPKFVVLSFVESSDGAIEPRLPMDADLLGSAELRESYAPVRSFDFRRDASFLDEIYYRHAPRARRIFLQVYERID